MVVGFVILCAEPAASGAFISRRTRDPGQGGRGAREKKYGSFVCLTAGDKFNNFRFFYADLMKVWGKPP